MRGPMGIFHGMEPQDRDSEIDYLHRIERLAHTVVEEAAREGLLVFGVAGESSARPVERAINDLATELRFVHHDGDGCIDH
jgi:hypothetical protein